MKEKSKYISDYDAPPFPGKRHFQFFLWFLLVIVAYGMRSNLSVAILAMMKDEGPTPDIPTFPHWTLKNTMLSSFFWGYIILQVGVGKIIQRFGARIPLTYAMFINSLFCILTPIFAIKLGEGGVIACRAIQGLHQGFIFPSLHALTEKWAPLAERGRVVAFVYTASGLGVFSSMLLTGVMSNDIGWPYAFYLYGGLGMVWVVLWGVFGSNQPNEHKSITKEERKYIEGGLRSEEEKEKEKMISTPWLDIFKSMPVWAVIVGHCGFQWGFWTLLTEIPSYLKNIMDYDLGNGSIIAAGPYLTLWSLSLVFGPFGDYCINKGYLTVGGTRKMLTTIGFLIPAAALTWLAFVDSTQKTLAVVLLFVAVGINSASYSGFNCNHIDIAPIHSAVLMGITNSLSNILSICAPLALDVIGYKETDIRLWRIVFLVAAFSYLVSDIFFVIFGSGEVQKWNNKEEIHEKNKDLEKIC